MKYLVCLLEEQSARELLYLLLPRVLPTEGLEICFQLFSGKQDLEKNLERRIKYWNKPNSVFLIMRDKDSGDCISIKKRLLDIISRTGKAQHCLVRIACHELESFYLGDLEAVSEAYDSPTISKLKNKRKFADPDRLANASDELRKLLPAGVSQSKIQWAQRIAPHIGDEQSNQSHSYRVLLSGLRKLLSSF